MQITAPLNSEPVPVLQSVEVATSFQIPSFHIIGLPAPEVAEARERIRAAVESSGFEFPRRRVVVNLSPASIKKRGTGLDLAMALAVLLDSSDTSAKALKLTAWGELGLDGTIKPAGQLTRMLFASWKAGVTHLIASPEDAEPASLQLEWLGLTGEFSGPPPVILSAQSLKDAWKLADAVSSGASSRAEETIQEARIVPLGESKTGKEPEAESQGLLCLSPALERTVGVAALGCHHLLLLGPKGAGKSHALEWLIALQPPASPQMKLRHALLLELAGNRFEWQASQAVPVRRVSSQARPSALIGAASTLAIRPGEFSLAHGGLLIADELPEWARDCREALREPMERGVVTLTRAHGTLELPARFILAGNGNLCPCGGWPSQFPIPMELNRKGSKPPRCTCSPSARTNYLNRLSGPVLDRLDLVLLTTASPQLLPEESSVQDRLKTLRARVQRSQKVASAKWGAPPGLLSASQLESLIKERPHWLRSLNLLHVSSLRSRHKILRVALSLAVWDERIEPTDAHFAEASCYRPDRFGLCD